jgi:hypothetical protein
MLILLIFVVQWLHNISRLEKNKPGEIASENNKLLFIIKLLHEIQHRATRLFLNLRAPLGPGANKLHTPESVGSMLFRGRPCGDSGYALEEVLLGGRLRHRHLVNRSPFVVSSLFPCVCCSR